MVNCNPETVSTDYDTSDRLFFEPLTYEDVLNVCEGLQRVATTGALKGVVVSLGGQTPLKLAHALEQAGITDPRHVTRVDRRGRGPRAVQRAVRTARDPAARGRHRDQRRRRRRDRALGRLPGARAPVLRARRARHGDRLRRRRPAPRDGRARATPARSGARAACRPSGPRSIDRFLEDAIEVDVDALRDVEGECIIGGIMEHIEEAGVHSGDSACAIPPPTLAAERARRRSKRHTRALAGRARSRRPAQRAVRGQGRRRCS